MTIQGDINSGPDGTMDEAKYNEYVKELVQRGFKKVEVEDLKREDQVKFVVENEGKKYFRTGGWILKTKLDSEDIDEDYILIKSHITTSNIRNYTISPEEIIEMWKLSKIDQPNAIPMYKKPNPNLKYKLYINDKEDNEILVYSTSRKEHYERAKNSEKYKLAQVKKQVRIKQ